MLASDALRESDNVALCAQQHCKSAGLRRPGKPKPRKTSLQSAADSIQKSWRALLKLSRVGGCEHLPASQQGIFPCGSTESAASSSCPTAAASAAVPQLLLPVPSADVWDVEIDVTSRCHSSSCLHSNRSASTASTVAELTTLLPGGPAFDRVASTSAPGAVPCTPQPLLCRRTTSCVLAAKAQQLGSVLKQAVQQQQPRTPNACPEGRLRLPWLPAKGNSRALQQPAASLPPLNLRGPAAQHARKQPRRAASLFEATGRENIRYLLGPHAVWGSVTRYKMLLLAEQVHEAHLQTVLNETLEQTDWAGEAAWEEDFSLISNRYGQRVRQFLFWWGGALSRLRLSSPEPEESPDQSCSGEEPAARVSVVLKGQEAGAPAAADVAAAAAAGAAQVVSSAAVKLGA